MTIEVSPKQKKSIFILLFLIPFLMGCAVNLYVPSLPAITQYFQVAKHPVQLTIALYMLGYATGQALLGVLSDSLGRRSIFIIGGFIFTLVSFLAAFSPNIYVLIICRFLQGFSIAGPAVVCRAIATDCFSGLSLNKAMTFITVSWALGPIIGPVIGGYLQHYFNWKADFYFFGLYAFLSFVYAAIALPETIVEKLPLHPVKILSIVKEISTHPIFVLYSVIASLIYGSLVVFNVIAPFLIQIDLNYSVIAFSAVSLLLGVAFFIGSLSNRILAQYFKPMKIVMWSLVVCLLLSCIMAGLGIYLKPNLPSLVIPVFLLFCCCGFAFPNIMTESVSLFPNNAGTSSAIYGSWLAGGVFVMSSVTTLLGTNNQTPLALLYIGMMLTCLLALALCQIISRFKKT